MLPDLSGSVERIVQASTGRKANRVERFALGLSHYVFDVETEDGLAYVVRLARPERRAELERGLYWHPRLAGLGIPLPHLDQSGEIEGYAFGVYERLPGRDLEQLYPELPPGVRRSLACSVAELQQKVSRLDDPQLRTAPRWPDVLQSILNRSAREIVQRGLGDVRFVDLARKQMVGWEAYFAEVRPVAFLYDLNVRNVMVHHEQISGIIDVDEVWFGDPLLAVGRGKTLLLLMQQDTAYITAWCDYLSLTGLQRKVVDLYALLYCVRFMGTLGQTLNGNKSIQTDPNNARILEHIAQNLIAEGLT